MGGTINKYLNCLRNIQSINVVTDMDDMIKNILLHVCSTLDVLFCKYIEFSQEYPIEYTIGKEFDTQYYTQDFSLTYNYLSNFYEQTNESVIVSPTYTIPIFENNHPSGLDSFQIELYNLVKIGEVPKGVLIARYEDVTRIDDNDKLFIEIISKSIREKVIFQKNEKTYSQLMQNAVDGVIIVSNQGIILEANKMVSEMFGYSVSELMGKSVEILIPDDFTKKHQRGMRGVVKSSEPQILLDHVKTNGRHKNGSLIYIEISISWLGQYYYDNFICYVYNLSHIERVNRALKTLSHSTKVIIESKTEEELLENIIVTLKDYGKYNYIWFGTLKERNSRNIIVPTIEYPHSYFGDFEYELLVNNPVSSSWMSQEVKYYNIIHSSEHDEQWINYMKVKGLVKGISLPLVHNSELLGILNIFSDTYDEYDREEVVLLEELANNVAFGLDSIKAHTKIVVLANELGRTEKEFLKLVTAIEQSPNIIFITDISGRIEYVNPTFTIITGYSAEESLGRTPKFLKSGEMNMAEYDQMWKTILSGREWYGDLQNKSKSGDFFWVRSSIAPVIDTSGRIINFIAIQKDITFEKNVQAKLMETQNMETLSLLSGGIAHDFNNLLTGILGNISLAHIEIDLDLKGEYILESVNAIYKAIKLTEQLLSFSKNGLPSLEITNLANLIRETVRFTLRGSNVKATIDVDPNLWDTKIDIGQINQVIQNLVINSKQAMPYGGELTIRARNIHLFENITDLPSGKYLKLEIEDTGIGIPKSIITRVFEPFFTTKPNGTGLGLATCQSIISNHKGKLELSSTQGVGTQVIIYLPALPDSFIENSLMEEELTLNGVIGKNILVMEDEPLVRDIYRKILNKIGCDYKIVTNHNNALNCYLSELSQSSFDAIFLDLTVAGGKGAMETLEEILEIDPNVKAIVTSGYSNSDILRNYQKYGFIGKLEKPFGVRELLQVIKSI